jgi:hypothetical protein
MQASQNRRQRADRPSTNSQCRVRHPRIEAIEARLLLTTGTVTVTATQTVRTIPAGFVGVNLAEWDPDLTNTTTQQDAAAAGIGFFRMPGGSTADTWHWNSSSNTMSVAQMAQFIQNVGGIGMQTIDYGEGSPQEGAALYAYFNSSPSNTTVIGTGQQWNGSAWVSVNWQTAGYWASLRAAAPINGNPGGLNFLRANHAASYNVNYWEVGNEEYGSWETDEHGQSGDTSLNGGPGAAHDPVTYGTFASQFSTLLTQIIAGDAAVGQTDAAHYIGVNAGGATGAYSSWITGVLNECNTLGFVPNYISDHSYMQSSGNENDSTLLTGTYTASGSSLNWSVRAAAYRTLLNKYSWGSSVELLNTEFNSVSTDPDMQSTSLVNGLFVADSIGSIMQTEYDDTVLWDLQNSYAVITNQAGLYGWRTGGDYGILGKGDVNDPPSTGLNVPYPTYFAVQLVSEIVQTGDKVVSTSSNNSLLDAYGVMESSDGDLDILVINKSSSASFTETFKLPGFLPSGQAEIWQYGETQDTAQSQSTTGASALANSSTTFTITNSGGVASFSDTFPQYSMSVIQLTPDSGPVVNVAASGTPTSAGTGVVLSVGASGGTGASTLNYTWSTLSAPAGIASPTFSVNGTNGAASDSATIYGTGNYVFLVTVTDTNNLSTTSNAPATISQVFTTLNVSPGTLSLPVDSTYQFNTAARDQFNNGMASPAVSWSVTGANNSISASGLLSLGNPKNRAQVSATSGSVVGTAIVTPLAATAPQPLPVVTPIQTPSPIAGGGTTGGGSTVAVPAVPVAAPAPVAAPVTIAAPAAIPPPATIAAPVATTSWAAALLSDRSLYGLAIVPWHGVGRGW